MNIWPFSRRETRSSAYTDALIGQILSQSASDAVSVAATAAVETVAGIVQRAFAAADVDAPDAIRDALTPAFLGSIGRALIRRGECVQSIRVDRGRLMLIPAADWNITGSFDPASWRYRLTLAGPTVLNTQTAVTADSVIHPRYSYDHERPWIGIGPLQSAALAGKLSAETVNALADESGSMMGFIAPQPKDGNDPTVLALRADLRNAKGRTRLVQSQGAAWGVDERGNYGRADWQRHRWGPEPPPALVELEKLATNEVLMACGISPALYGGATASAAREGFRQLLHGTIAPLGRLVLQELRDKLDPSITLSFDSLAAADVMGKARAFQSLTGGGMAAESAARVAGVDVEGVEFVAPPTPPTPPNV